MRVAMCVRLLRLYHVASFMYVVVVIKWERLHIFMRVVVPFNERPVAIGNFIVRRRRGEFVLVLTPARPIFAVLDSRIDCVSFVPDNVSLNGGVQVVVVSLVVRGRPVIGPNEL